MFVGATEDVVKNPDPAFAQAQVDLPKLAGLDTVRVTTFGIPGQKTRGLLEGLYAARAGVSLARAAGVDAGGTDARVPEVVAPLRASLLGSLGAERVGGYGVSGARLVDRHTAYVLLLPEFGDEHVVEEASWKPSHLLAFVYESRDWLIDLGKTAELSADADLPDPLSGISK